MLANRQVTLFSLSLCIAIQAFGPLTFIESFHYLPAAAARMNSYFWLGNIGALIAVGIICDRLRSRRSLLSPGAAAAGLSLCQLEKFTTYQVAIDGSGATL